MPLAYLAVTRASPHRRRSGFFAPLSAVAIAAIFMIPNSVSATSLPLGWSGAQRVSVLCQVAPRTASGALVESDAIARTLCARVKALALRGAPVPVETVGYGDASLRSGSTLALYVQGSVIEATPSRRLLVFTMRTERVGATEAERTFFGAAPRPAPFASATEGGAWDAAIGASLAELLPWLQPAEGRHPAPTKRQINRERE